MFDKFDINYYVEGVKVTLTFAEDAMPDSLPFDIALMFSKVIRDAGVNGKVVIDNMKQYLKVE